MKKAILFAVILFFSWQFCAGFVQTQSRETKTIITDVSFVKNTSNTIIVSLLPSSLQIENSVKEPNNFFPLSKKNQSKTTVYYSKIKESIFFNAFSQYTILYRNYPLQFQKTDIIFPFHNFW